MELRDADDDPAGGADVEIRRVENAGRGLERHASRLRGIDGRPDVAQFGRGEVLEPGRGDREA